MFEPTYKFCPTCGEPVEADRFDLHVISCNGSIPVTASPLGPPTAHPRFWRGSESIADRAERLADRDLYPDGTERGRRW